jgi:hypothetical protein
MPAYTAKIHQTQNPHVRHPPGKHAELHPSVAPSKIRTETKIPKWTLSRPEPRIHRYPNPKVRTKCAVPTEVQDLLCYARCSSVASPVHTHLLSMHSQPSPPVCPSQTQRKQPQIRWHSLRRMTFGIDQITRCASSLCFYLLPPTSPKASSSRGLVPPRWTPVRRTLPTTLRLDALHHLQDPGARPLKSHRLRGMQRCRSHGRSPKRCRRG